MHLDSDNLELLTETEMEPPLQSLETLRLAQEALFPKGSMYPDGIYFGSRVPI